jgi:hypothetical protein
VERQVGPTTVMGKEVLAQVQGTEVGGRVQVLDYALELTQRAGRWEVSKLLPGPTLAETQRPPSATPSTQPATANGSPPPSTISVLEATSTTAPTTNTPTTVSGLAPATAERTTTTR